MLEQLAAAGLAVNPGQDAGIGGGVDHPIDRADCLQVAREAHVAVTKLDAEFGEFAPVTLAAWAAEIIETDEAEFAAGPMLAKAACERAADKAAAPRDEYPHAACDRSGACSCAFTEPKCFTEQAS